MNYDKLARLYLTKFTSGIGSISDLSRSLEICELVDSLMIKQVMVREEDAVLNFLKIGRTMYSKGIETCYLLYENSRNGKFLEKAHFFMERSKGILLFRDALTNDFQSFSYVPIDFRAPLKTTIQHVKEV